MPRSGPDFVDFYQILQVSPDCSPRELEVAYHLLAKRYHPDTPATADVDRFSEAIAAYRMLRDPDAREAYDQQYFPEKTQNTDRPQFEPEEALDERTAVADAEMHARILLHLYRKRRERSSDPGVIQWLLQEALGCSEDAFDFYVWYLKSKGFVEVTEHSGLAITIAGVDEVIAQSRATRAERLLLTLSDPPAAESPDEHAPD